MKFAPYTSGRLKELKVGITSYSEDKFSLDIVGVVTAGSYRTGSSNLHSDGADLKNLNVTGVSTFGGNVAIGTDNVYDPVGASNTSILAVGILTANTIFSTVYGQFTGGSVVATNIVGTALSVSGISTLGSVKISSGIITAASGVVTYFGDGSGLTGTGNTADVKTNSLQVLGISTFTGDLDVNGNIIGDSATNISGINSVTATNFFGSLTGNVTGNLTGNADTATSSATVTDAAQPNITSLGSLTGLNVVGITTVGGDIKANGNIVGDNSTNITGIAGVTATTLAGTLQTAAQPNVTSLGTLSSLSVTGNVSIGGTLTYDDVTNIDSVGLITARSGINVTGGGLNVVGVGTFVNDIDANGSLTVVGSVGIGTTDPNATVNSNNTSKLAVGILTARQIFSTLYGQFTGGSVIASNIVGTALSISGISTLGGNVAIGTDNVTDPVGAGNTAILAVGILTARRIFSSLHGEFTGGSVIASNIVGSALSVSGISTIGIVQISSGIITATSGIVTYFGDGSNLTGVSGSVAGISTAGTSNFEKIVVNDLVVGSGASVVGIVTASAFAGFKYLQAPFGSTTTFTVTVASKDATHRYNGTGSGNAYLINGVQSPILTLTPGRTYRFTNDNTGSHPLKFYYEADKTTLYTTGVNFQNTYTEITVSDTTPNVLHYQCTAHAYMGNAVVTNSNVVDTTYTGTFRAGQTIAGVSTFAGNINANGNIVGDNSTNITGIAGVTATTLAGTLQTAAQPNVTSLGTLTSLNVTGDVSIGGTLTYDDVTNIDSVGLITARSGVRVSAGGLTVTGVSTFSNNVLVNTTQSFETANGFGDIVAGDGSGTTGITVYSGNGTGNEGGIVFADGVSGSASFRGGIRYQHDIDAMMLFTTGGEKMRIDGSGNLNVTGVVTATTFSGSGASLNSIPNSALDNSTVSYGGISLALGGTDATPAFNLTDATNYPYTSLTGITTDIVGDTTPTLGGNLDGNSKSIFGVGVLTATSFSGTLLTAAQTNITSLGTLSALTVSGDITANGNIAGDGATNITGIAGVTASTLAGTLQTAAQPNITSLGTLGALTVSGNINANGNIIGDNATNISGINSVTATTYFGDGTKLTGISTSGDITDQTGITTSIGTFNVSAGIATNIDSFAYASNNYKTAEYTIHFMNGSKTQAQKLLVMQDGATAFSNEFAVMSSSNLLISVGATVSGSNVLVQATPETGVSGVTTFRWRREVQD